MNNLIGQKFGRLLVIGVAKNKRGHTACLCLCDKDNNKTLIEPCDLLSGHTRSCGCLKLERWTTHGLSRHPLRDTWKSMMSRCYNTRAKDYHSYGGRGIRVCDAWHRIENFITDIQPIYVKGKTLHRKDNNLDYCLENVEYATDEVQANHKTTTFYIEYNGKTQSLAMWSRELNINYPKLRMRLRKYNWTVERAFTTP